MRYFIISIGLRGGFMPDSSFPFKTETRRELAETLEYEAESLRDAGFSGLSKRNCRRLAAMVWRDNGRQYLPLCLPYGPGKNRQFGLMVCSVTLQEYKQAMESANYD